MDKLTVKIMSWSCKMADITEEGVSCKNYWIICLVSKVQFSLIFIVVNFIQCVVLAPC